MNYRHAFHAGNAVDVFKHAVLIGLLEALIRKPAPFAYLETHAGCGCYDLDGAEARRSGEAEQGIQALFRAGPGPGALLVRLLDIVGSVQPAGSAPGRVHRYPGSPLIAATLARSQDRLILAELHPDDHRALHAHLCADRRVAVHHMDGYQLLKAFLPPPAKRGLVLIDPPYERADEFECLHEALESALRRWANGIYAVWYPVKADAQATAFLRRLERSGLRRIMRVECVFDPSGPGLQGSGMVLINPPWRIEETLEPMLTRLREVFGNPRSRMECEWLVPE